MSEVAVSTDDAVAPTCRDVPLVGMAVSEIGSTRWIDANPTLCELLGYSRDQLLRTRWADLTHPEDREISRIWMEKAQRGEVEHYRLFKRYIRADGGIVHAMLDVRPVKHEGAVRWLLAAIVDISEQRQAEEATRKAASLLERFSENMPGIFYEFVQRADGTSSLPYASRGMHELFGFQPGDLLHDASPFFERIHADDVPLVLDSIRASAATLTPWLCEFRYLSPNQAQRWFRGESRPQREANGDIRWFGFMSDATHWHQQQEALAESERQLRFLFDHAAEGILVFDADTRLYVEANPSAERILGYPREALIGRSPLDLSAPIQPDGSTVETYMARAMRTIVDGLPFAAEWSGVHADGHIVPCELRLTPIPVVGRRLIRGTMVEIGERVRARAAVERLQQAIESSVNGVAMTDVNGDLTYVNRAFLSLWGYENAEQALGRSALSFWAVPAQVADVIRTLLSHGSWSGELEALRDDGQQRTMELNASAIRDAQGTIVGLLASFADVTETKQLQLELQQSQKLESIGRLAGGVAHDFNNLLTVIKASLDLACSDLPLESAARDDLREAAKAADSAARLTQQLLAFSRKQVIAPTVFNLNDVVHRVAAMLQRLLGEDIVLRTVTAHDLGAVRFDAGQAEQILINMAVNARDAMPDGGELVIETRNVTVLGDGTREHPGVRPGDYILLMVSDTGEGMSDEVLAHAFEPFFTTKAAGKGTGLGLAVIHGAVTQNGGRVEVSSRLGHGTTFRVYLPRTTTSGATAGASDAPPMPGGTEGIIVVEDDTAVRQLMTRLLMSHGYRVHAFEGGPRALDWLATTDEPLALLLTDVIMPVMNGKQLADAVTRLRPGIGVLYASGYTANVIEHHGVLDADTAFLPKPFDVRNLLVMVRDTIDAR